MKLGAGVCAPYKPSVKRKHVGPSLGGGIKALGVGLFVTSVPVVTQASTAPFFNKATFGGLSDEMCYPEIVAVPSHGPTELTTGSLKPTTESPASGDTEDTGIVAGVYAGGVVTVGGIIAVGVFSGNRANVMAAAVGGVVGTALLPVMMEVATAVTAAAGVTAGVAAASVVAVGIMLITVKKAVATFSVLFNGNRAAGVRRRTFTSDDGEPESKGSN